MPTCRESASSLRPISAAILSARLRHFGVLALLDVEPVASPAQGDRKAACSIVAQMLRFPDATPRLRPDRRDVWNSGKREQSTKRRLGPNFRVSVPSPQAGHSHPPSMAVQPVARTKTLPYHRRMARERSFTSSTFAANNDDQLRGQECPSGQFEPIPAGFPIADWATDATTGIPSNRRKHCHFPYLRSVTLARLASTVPPVGQICVDRAGLSLDRPETQRDPALRVP